MRAQLECRPLVAVVPISHLTHRCPNPATARSPIRSFNVAPPSRPHHQSNLSPAKFCYITSAIPTTLNFIYHTSTFRDLHYLIQYHRVPVQCLSTIANLSCFTSHSMLLALASLRHHDPLIISPDTKEHTLVPYSHLCRWLFLSLSYTDRCLGSAEATGVGPPPGAYEQDNTSDYCTTLGKSPGWW